MAGSMTSSSLVAQPSRPARKATAKLHRFQIRLSARQRELLERAAILEGRTLTDFVLTHAQGAAQHTIEMESLLVLSSRDTGAFLAAMESSWEPSGDVLEEVRAMRVLLGERLAHQ